ncbi:hypothetical protein AMOR_35460 [Anaeromyxobacter oryzae]|uniref:Cyclic nucleotide-binding domain-containing protein n=1 Tax=Anaeromyxobacter oryzae TaxID=2918170 RepID=A0ABM7WYE1_9BACT|nr:hypothetical protein AMOR_35460 [Anaeromyxobacter oryzae]
MPDLPAGWSAFYRVVRRIPRGQVATYGEVALLAGKPRAARQVGYALAALRGAKHDIPWQRVLGTRPRGHAAISILDPMGAAVQRDLLETEGVAFDERGLVALDRFGWSRARRATRTSRGAARRPPRAGSSRRSSRARTRGRRQLRPSRYPTRTGGTFQISSAYSRMVRSEENFPVRATFRIAMRVQCSGSR